MITHLLLAAFVFFQPLQPPRPFQVMVHRGSTRQAPENTRPALERCIEDGFEWAEVDVRLTKDGHHVLFHDARLDGKTNGTGLVKEHTLAELLALDAGASFASRFAGQRLLTLAQCLEIAKGRLNLYLDCKDIDVALLAREILDAGMEHQVVAFDSLENLQKVRDLSGGKIAIMPKWRPSFGLKDWIAKYHPEAVEIDADAITADICRTFHARGIRVQAKVLGDWDKADIWEKLLGIGVDWFQTDLPEELIAQAIWKKNTKRPVRVSFHRGAGRYAPENTLPAFDKAIRMGADFVEFDVRTTSDGRTFLLHDGNLSRTAGSRDLIAQVPSATVSGLDAGSWFGKPYAGTRIPSLEEFLTAVRGRVELYFDAKAITAEALSAALERLQLTDQTVVYQGAEFLKGLKSVNPRIRRLPPLSNRAQIDAIAADVQPYAFDTSWEILSRELIARCHALGINVFSDSIGRHEKIEDYQQAIDWGIDLIQTDHPLRVMRAVELRSSK